MKVTLSMAVKKKLNSQVKARTVSERITRELLTGGANIERDAKKALQRPTPLGAWNFGQLAASVRHFIARDGNAVVVKVGTPLAHGAFTEFGTGKKGAQGPHNETAKALMKKMGYKPSGKEGRFPPLLVIARWAKRKGLSEFVFPIARAIAKNGLRARPFLTPAFEKWAPQTLDRIKRVTRAALEV